MRNTFFICFLLILAGCGSTIPEMSPKASKVIISDRLPPAKCKRIEMLYVSNRDKAKYLSEVVEGSYVKLKNKAVEKGANVVLLQSTHTVPYDDYYAVVALSGMAFECRVAEKEKKKKIEAEKAEGQEEVAPEATPVPEEEKSGTEAPSQEQA